MYCYSINSKGKESCMVYSHKLSYKVILEMGSKGGLILLCFLVVIIQFLGTHSNAQSTTPAHYRPPFNRSAFPDDFVFGAASAAYQVLIYLLIINNSHYTYIYKQFIKGF